MKSVLLLLTLLALVPISTHAQRLEQVTSLKLEYWRAFHGVIKQEIIVSGSGEIALKSDVMPGKTASEQEKNKEHTVKTITQQDLSPILTLFNDIDARQFFASTQSEAFLAGSTLSITVRQNSFSITFTSQDAFVSKSLKYPAELGRLAAGLFKKAGINIPADELY